MTALIGWAFTATLLVLLTIWFGPRLLLWIVNCYIAHWNRIIRKFNERQAKRAEEIRAAMAELEQAMELRKEER